MSKADGTSTKPAAGVIATSPATAPVTVPSAVGRPRCPHSMRAQTSPVVAAAVLVFTNACTARPPAERALPALNPNQPNHSRPPPRTVVGMLWGRKALLGKPRRLPSTMHATRAETPELMWTTVPPAKSRAGSLMFFFQAEDGIRDLYVTGVQTCALPI